MMKNFGEHAGIAMERALAKMNRKENRKGSGKEICMKTWRGIIESEFSSFLPSLPFCDEQENFKLLAECYRVGMFYGCPFESEELDYLDAEDLLNYSVLSVITDDIDSIKVLLEYQTRKRLIWYILDMLIQCAIDNKKTEIQVMLVDYKHRNNLFKNRKFEL